MPPEAPDGQSQMSRVTIEYVIVNLDDADTTVGPSPPPAGVPCTV